MIKISKTVMYPGNHGQAAYCQIQIALSDEVVRPKIFVLLDHDSDYQGSRVVNSSFSCDHVINKIFKEDLAGLNIHDVKVYYQNRDAIQGDMLEKIPLQFSWDKEIPWWSKMKSIMGSPIQSYPTLTQEKCGNCVVSTGINVQVKAEEATMVLNAFDIQACNADQALREVLL